MANKKPVSKSEAKRLAVQKPAPVEVVETKKYLTIILPLHGGKPVVQFGGEWFTKEVKLILRAIPRAYRLHQINKRKQNLTGTSAAPVNGVSVSVNS